VERSTDGRRQAAEQGGEAGSQISQIGRQRKTMRYWMRKAVRTGAIAATGFLALVLAASVWLILSKFWLKQEIPSVFGYSPIYVLSGSMEPVFSAGDMIIIHPQSQYEPGDVVTFYSEGELVTHRIIGESLEGFTVKGDANNVQDEELVKAREIVGKQVLVLPHIGSIALFFRTGKGMMLLSAVVLVAVLQSVRGQPGKTDGSRDRE